MHCGKCELDYIYCTCMHRKMYQPRCGTSSQFQPSHEWRNFSAASCHRTVCIIAVYYLMRAYAVRTGTCHGLRNASRWADGAASRNPCARLLPAFSAMRCDHTHAFCAHLARSRGGARGDPSEGRGQKKALLRFVCGGFGAFSVPLGPRPPRPRVWGGARS